MIRSMTGFGAAAGVIGGRQFAVDVRSVNHRFFTSTIRLTGGLSRYEVEVRDLLKRRLTRGHVTLTARYEDAVAGTPAIDEQRVTAWVSALRGLRDRHQLAGDVDLATLLRLPDLFASAETADEGEGKALVAVCEEAIASLTVSREVEGGALAAYLAERLRRVEDALERLDARAPERVVAHRDRLTAAVAELAGNLAIDPQRLAQEVALLAERMDVGEEISRFRVHIGAFRETLRGAPDGVGKRLGFLLQEMLREANTTGSKANDVAMTADVVLIKEELERLREQVENIE